MNIFDPMNTSSTEGDYFRWAKRCRIAASAKQNARSPRMVADWLPLSKIHYADFEAYLTGIDGDFMLHVPSS